MQTAFVEGVEEGKTKTIQSGFDRGYELAFGFVQKVNVLKGFAK